MVSPYFKASDKVRDLSKYVIISALVVLFLNYFNVTLEKIPFTDLPIPKGEQTKLIFSASALVSLMAIYTWAQLVILYFSEFVDFDRLELESIVASIKSGDFGKLVPAEAQKNPQSQEAFANLQADLARVHRKIQIIGWTRILNEIVLPTGLLTLAIYVDTANLRGFAASLYKTGALHILVWVMVILVALFGALYFIGLLPEDNNRAKRVLNCTAVVAAVLVLAGLLYWG